MSRFFIGNMFLLGSMICGVGSQLLLKSLLNEYKGSLLRWSDIVAFLDVAHIFRGFISSTMLVMGFIFWIFALFRLDMSYAYPIASSSVVLVMVFGAFFLGESVTPRMYIGSILILGGIILLMPNEGSI